MKFKFFNDTGAVINIHPATFIHGCQGDDSPIPPLEIREFNLPKGTYPMLKLWKENIIFVCPEKEEGSK